MWELNRPNVGIKPSETFFAKMVQDFVSQCVKQKKGFLLKRTLKGLYYKRRFLAPRGRQNRAFIETQKISTEPDTLLNPFLTCFLEVEQ